jgi:hypothetical protein
MAPVDGSFSLDRSVLSIQLFAVLRSASDKISKLGEFLFDGSKYRRDSRHDAHPQVAHGKGITKKPASVPVECSNRGINHEGAVVDDRSH